MVDLPDELVRKVMAYMERPLHYYAYITGLKQVSNYDLSGVDKKNNLGVYNFKKGTGSLEFLKVGEYLEAPFFIFKLFFFCIIFLKRIFIK